MARVFNIKIAINHFLESNLAALHKAMPFHGKTQMANKDKIQLF